MKFKGAVYVDGRWYMGLTGPNYCDETSYSSEQSALDEVPLANLLHAIYLLIDQLDQSPRSLVLDAGIAEQFENLNKLYQTKLNAAVGKNKN